MVDTKNTKDGKVGTKNTKKEQGSYKRSSGWVRECLKEEPLQPVYTGKTVHEADIQHEEIQKDFDH